MCGGAARSRQIFGDAKEFCPKSPKLARKKTSTSKKNSSLSFGCRRHFGSYFQGFAQIFRDCVKVFRDFAQISTDFSRIFTASKLLVVRLHPLDPSLLHQWCSIKLEYYDNR